ncbi:MAG: cytochrome c3 family protein [Gemmatimonadota bacterium]
MTLRALLGAAALLAAALPAAGPAAAAGPGVKECLECHGDSTIEKTLPDGKTLSLFVDEKAYRASVHGKGACTTCHADATASHGKLAPVNCGRCHADAAKSYAGSTHGKDRAKGATDVAGCADCHGKHDILAPKNPKSRTFRLNVADVCLGCHKDRVIEEKYKLPGRQVMEAYEQGVHGMASRKSGLLGSAVCPDCHGNHAILPGDQPRSATYRQNIPTMCGKCHPGILEQYERSVHGKGMRAGIAESPVCTDCHGEHTITKITDPSSSVNARNIPKTCSGCHENIAIESRYALPKKRLSTYMDSFHGVAVEYGMTKAANCASCHGFHDVLPSSDPASPVNKANLPKTCGKCHPNAGPNFAKGIVHVEVTPQKALGVFAVRVFYTLFIGVLVLLFVLHVGMDLLGRMRRRRAGGAGEGGKTG